MSIVHLVSKNDSDDEAPHSSKWTMRECRALQKAVKKYGTRNHWSEIASCFDSRFNSPLGVGTRTVSQCVNKWRNDISMVGKKVRWTKASTTDLQSFLNQGKTEKEIRKLMPQYTYIQIYQHIRRLQCNHEPSACWQGVICRWEDWEVTKLKELRDQGIRFAEIGRQLKNRHRDDVKNTWIRLYKNHSWSGSRWNRSKS